MSTEAMIMQHIQDQLPKSDQLTYRLTSYKIMIFSSGSIFASIEINRNYIELINYEIGHNGHLQEVKLSLSDPDSITYVIGRATAECEKRIAAANMISDIFND